MKKYLLFLLIILNIGLGLDVQAKSETPFIVIGPPVYTPNTTTTGSVVVSFDCSIGGGWSGWCEHPSWSCNKFTCSKTFNSNTSGTVTVEDSNYYGEEKTVNYSVTNIVIPPTPPIITPPIIIVPPVETAPACNLGPVPYGCSSGNPYAQNETSANYTWSCANTLGDINCTKNKPVVTPTVTPVIIGSPWPTITDGGSAFDSMSSGISTAHYELIWCTSHANEISGLTDGCRTQLFSDEGGVATLLTDGSVNSPASLIDGMGFKIIGEGVLTIKTFISDNASNISKKTYVYKIDKTAPRFGDFVFTEKSLQQYINIENYTGTDGQPSNLGVNDLSTQSDGDIFPTLSSYTKLSDLENPYSQDPLTIQQVRYKQTGLGATSPVVNVELQGATDTFGGIANHNFVSRADKIEFYKGIKVLPDSPSDYYKKIDIDLTSEINAQKQIDLETFDFSKSGTAPIGENDGRFINVRLSDNAGNYSEKAFYVYRDESKPDPNLFALNFTNGDNLLLTSKNSRMIPANESTAINYNWGANDHMAPNIKLKTEQHNNSAAQQIAVLSANTSGVSSPAFNLSDVDATDINEIETGNYRNYSVSFETPGISGNQICDIVGNCIDGSTVFKNFRVMANIIDNSTSTLKVNMPISGTAFANNPNPGNNPDKYAAYYSLRDKYSNRIRNTYLGAIQIRNVSTELDFINGLNTSHTSNLHGGDNNNAVDIFGTELTGNINLNNVVLKENNPNSNGDFEFSISSKIPTVGGYHYMSDSAVLELSSVENKIIHSNTSSIYLPVDQNELLSFNGTKVIDIESTIREEKNNRFNINQETDLSGFTDLARYGKITSGVYNDSLLGSQGSRFNFEFASPFIYHVENLNILRDGINTQHKKNIVNNGTGIGTYMVADKFFDADNINSNIRVDFYIDDVLKNVFNTLSGNSINNSFLAKYSAKAGSNFDTWGYVSYIGYQAGDGTTYIPSISRGIIANVPGQATKASAHFPNVSSSGSVNFLTEDIAITGLVNKIDGLVNNDVQVGLASLDLERPYTRAELLERIKKKIFTVNKINKWCTGDITDLDMSSSDHSNCSFNINNEKIAFYKGNVTIDCGSSCDISGLNSLIVMDGRITIKSNINTNSNNGQILLASITDKGLENINISSTITNDRLLSSGKQKGWMSIDESVTNIDAFLLSQGPLVSSDSNGDVITNYQTPDQLLNQLHIYGSVFSLNTISGDKTGKCPYIEQNCTNADTQKVYDLSFLRRYTLVNASDFGGVFGMVPYDSSLDLSFPSSRTNSKSSGDLIYDGNGIAYGSSGLRTAKIEHIKAPVIIERDHRWSTNPSYFAKD